MNKRFIQAAAATAAIALALTGCVQKVDSGSATTGTIKIGVFEPMTGANGGGGTMEVEGAKLANKLYPEVNGQKIELVIVDNKSDKVEAANAGKRLVEQDKVKAIIGSWGSGLSMSAGATFQAAKVPAVAASATNPNVTLNNPYYFRVCFIDPFQGTVLARLAFNELKAKKVSVIQEITNDYSVGLAKFFTDEFTKLGGTVVDGGKYNTGDTDFNAALTTVKSQAPDVIFAPGNFTESALIIKQARQLGLTQPFLGGDTWETPEFITTGGAAVDGAMFTTFFATEQPINDTSKKFIEEYKKEYNKEPSAVAALAFDAYLVIRDAMEKTKSTDGETLQKYLSTLKAFPGAAGPITMNETRDAVKDVVIKTVSGGKFTYKTTIKAS
ncbi:ABC transporter substrate-binding protein [Propioniciclava tarda]|uniref:ABC transporter substrate-binding protein n=1 Tax=Propioniciclava tarda TaxID=433330 RepID=A0A4Q9KL65_PROTD|nr:ABC transporter substrate-binding protein [Propioniciclava tarda]TBT95208.1 ABC transporter substrate-binding protein [Propioniciclava tarda]SMO52115.1 amino acid/amide ABC transporter substrate-binding protein, HAAT family [Propioniciclava tarda]HOA89684.1 ABC transporter substrate-binding protein [Propioniciclava tarda]HQA31265.1 ABC transporter substrate-binding protein [Propioniciclava tarda]HQD60829.1 ABC transporter substrate-binding protein [Propioniciclava tarda]